MRVLNANTITLDIPLQYYIQRIDMWSGNTTEEDLKLIEVRETFLLEYIYIILCELGSREKPLREIQPTIFTRQTLQNVEEQKISARKWITTTGDTFSKKNRV
jgi:hypothetical protein